ncbi:MAG: adenylosuccinate synthetase [Erythrobacter sp.]
MIAKAVIGAGYGDEGKGRLVDWLAAPHGPEALVVRSNGGAQAAHTVVRGGKRHVFHHVGSGTLAGARTHLSRFMVSHPILLADELAELGALGCKPVISADPRGMVTTPWDMMVNQALEMARGGKRHGSCGLGFGETVGRCEETEFGLTLADLAGPALRATLIAIRDEWLPARCEALGLGKREGPLEFAQSQALLDTYVNQCEEFLAVVEIRGDATLGNEKALIFEAAQGLLLDQHGRDFPYLTRSNTGMANIAAIASEAGIAEIEPIYATRCYLTRHGRGPMEDERDIAHWFDVDDPTNRPNPWQERLRFGLIDPLLLASRIAVDLADVPQAVRPALAVTCLDQARSALAWLQDANLLTGSPEDFAAALCDASGFDLAAMFASPANDWRGSASAANCKKPKEKRSVDA